MKNADLSPLSQAWDALGKLLQPLFAEHAFLTILCAFFAVVMTLGFYRFLKSISAGLVAFILVLIFGLLTLRWTSTRSEPPFLKPVIDVIAPFFPTTPHGAGGPKKPVPDIPAPPRPAKS